MNNALMCIDSHMLVGSDDAFIARAYQIPLLSAEEELSLARDFKEKGNIDAARRLVLSHIRFVAKIARHYSGYGLNFMDLVQEGNIGLMKAVKRFDPEMGVRLVSFAVHWIKAEIHEFVIKNWRVVKIATTKAQRKLFFNLRSAKKRLGWATKKEINEIASDLGVTPKEVEHMEMRLNANDTAFDLRGSDTDDDNTVAPASYIEAQDSDPALLIENQNAEETTNHSLHHAMAILDPRSQDILRRRWLAEKKATLHNLALEYDVSPERIRQIEANAMKKMKKAMEEDLDA